MAILHTELDVIKSHRILRGSLEREGDVGRFLTEKALYTTGLFLRRCSQQTEV
jgi:hypothetical protein